MSEGGLWAGGLRASGLRAAGLWADGLWAGGLRAGGLRAGGLWTGGVGWLYFVLGNLDSHQALLNAVLVRDAHTHDLHSTHLKGWDGVRVE